MDRNPETEMEKIARLSGLSLSEEEKKILFSDMSRIVPYMERISKLDTSSVDFFDESEPAALREDEEEESPIASTIVSSAPESSDGMFSVPRIV